MSKIALHRHNKWINQYFDRYDAKALKSRIIGLQVQTIILDN